MVEAGDAAVRVEIQAQKVRHIELWALRIATIVLTTALVSVGILTYRDVQNEAKYAREHRVRNEQIHGCTNHKLDELRRDIRTLIEQQDVDAFPGTSDFTCPPSDPEEGVG